MEKSGSKVAKASPFWRNPVNSTVISSSEPLPAATFSTGTP